jgi:hypothetical protein
MSYLPIPPRAWTRVQSQCTYINPDTSYNSIYIPLTGQTVSPSEAAYYDKLQYKGNILQYKKNSIGLSKRQKYAQLAKGLGPSRTKVFATQTQTYTNPNTSSLLRAGFTTYSFPNNQVGEPNNPAGPFQYNVPNPNGCSSTNVQDGGSLISGVYANPCTNAIIKDTNVSQQCFPTYCSDVPGKPQLLCWNSKQQTYYPKQQIFMNNSLNKWPQGYKGFVSAITPYPPYLSISVDSSNNATLSWITVHINCLPITSYNIYKNGNLLKNVSNTTMNVTIAISNENYSFYVTSLINEKESLPSNIVYSEGVNSYSINTINNNTVDICNIIKNLNYIRNTNTVFVNSSLSYINNFYIIENTDNEENSIELSSYLKKLNTLVIISNKTNKILSVNSPYLLFNNLYYPDGTSTIELYNNNTLAVFYYFSDESSEEKTLNVLIF